MPRTTTDTQTNNPDVGVIGERRTTGMLHAAAIAMRNGAIVVRKPAICEPLLCSFLPMRTKIATTAASAAMNRRRDAESGRCKGSQSAFEKQQWVAVVAGERDNIAEHEEMVAHLVDLINRAVDPRKRAVNHR